MTVSNVETCIVNQIAVLPLESQHTAALNTLVHTTIGRKCHVELHPVWCIYRIYHVKVTTTATVLAYDMLVPANFSQAKLIVQFDGSLHCLQKQGGAGTALFQIDSTGITLL